MAESGAAARGRKRAIARGAYVVNQWGTAISGSGIPDQLWCYRGYFIALEWKHPSIKLERDLTDCNDQFASADQQLHLKAVRKAGGVAWVVNSVAHVDMILDGIDHFENLRNPLRSQQS